MDEDEWVHETIDNFWADRLQEINAITDFKNHALPLARIKKIMKSDEDVKMISSEAPAVFAKACEIFILDLTMRAWIHTELGKRKTLLRQDISLAVSRTESFDFLVDIVPREETPFFRYRMRVQPSISRMMSSRKDGPYPVLNDAPYYLPPPSSSPSPSGALVTAATPQVNSHTHPQLTAGNTHAPAPLQRFPAAGRPPVGAVGAAPSMVTSSSDRLPQQLQQQHQQLQQQQQPQQLWYQINPFSPQSNQSRPTGSTVPTTPQHQQMQPMYYLYSPGQPYLLYPYMPTSPQPNRIATSQKATSPSPAMNPLSLAGTQHNTMLLQNPTTHEISQRYATVSPSNLQSYYQLQHQTQQHVQQPTHQQSQQQTQYPSSSQIANQYSHTTPQISQHTPSSSREEPRTPPQQIRPFSYSPFPSPLPFYSTPQPYSPFTYPSQQHYEMQQSADQRQQQSHQTHLQFIQELPQSTRRSATESTNIQHHPFTILGATSAAPSENNSNSARSSLEEYHQQDLPRAQAPSVVDVRVFQIV